MSEQGLEVLDSTVQKTHLWLSDLAHMAHTDRTTAFKALRAVLHTLRDRLPVQEAAHFAAELPVLIRGFYYEGWRPSDTPVKYSHQEFLDKVEESIVSAEPIDPVRITTAVLEVLDKHLSPGEIEHLETVEKEHARIETRRYWITGETGWMADRLEWEGLKSIGMVESMRDIEGKVTTERRFFLCSIAPEAAAFARAVRGHWAIENTLH